MFEGCNSLKSIDLLNFNTSNAIDFSRIFDNCQNLTFINLLNYNGNDIFTSLNQTDNLEIYISDYDKMNDEAFKSLKEKNVKIKTPKQSVLKPILFSLIFIPILILIFIIRLLI